MILRNIHNSSTRVSLRVHDRVARIKSATASIKKHPMCARFDDDGERFTVIFPPGDFSVEGVSASHLVLGKGVALERLLDKMEALWMGSYPAGSFR